MPQYYNGLVDAQGRPIEKALLTQEVAVAKAGSVRSPIAGYPGDGLTPPRLAAILREADQGQPLRFYELAEQIEERDLHYSAVLGVRKRSVAQIDISVEPAGDDPLSQEQAKRIEDWLTRDELAEELFDMLDAIGKGESFTDIMWDSSSGQWEPKRLEHRDPRFFRPSRVDLKTPMKIGDSGEDEPIPGGKIIHLVARGKSGLPARSGLARLACWFWLFKGMTTRDWAMYAATFGQPLRVGKYGPNASEGDKDTLFQAVASIAGDCAAIIPASMMIEFIQPPSGTSTDLFERRANWLDQQMSKATLGQTATTDAISGGHAVSQEHRLVQEDIERADAKVLAAAINRDLIRTWIDLDFGPQKRYPRIVIARPEAEDLAALSTQLSQLVPLGLRVSQRQVRGKLGLEDPDPAEEILAPRPTPVQPGAGGNPLAPPPTTLPLFEARQAAELPTLPPPPDAEAVARAIDQLAERGDALAMSAMDQLFGLIEDAIANANSLEDVRTRLLELAPTLSSKGLALALRQAQVVARLSGRAELVDG